MNSIQWVCQIDGKKSKPVTSVGLRKLAAKGVLKSTDLVRKQGTQKWVPADRLKGVEFLDTEDYLFDDDFAPIENAPRRTKAPAIKKKQRKRNPRRPVTYAGFWLRFCAFFIDSILFIIVFGAIDSVAAFLRTLNIAGLNAIASLVLTATFFSFIPYFALMESSVFQATVGKMLLRLKVTDLKGKRLTFGRALGRNLGKLQFVLSYVSGIYQLGAGSLFNAAFSEKKQANHDFDAGCLVLKK